MCVFGRFGIGQFFAPDPAYLASKYYPSTNGSSKAKAAVVAVSDIPQSIPSSSRIESDPYTPPEGVISSLVSESEDMDDDDLDRDITERVRNLVLDSCHGTAETLASSASDWEETKNFFTICSSLKQLNEVKKNKLAKMLKKSPNLAVSVFASLKKIVFIPFKQLVCVYF